jgi:meiotically up-regulated gene 157 (Mug157) protein
MKPARPIAAALVVCALLGTNAGSARAQTLMNVPLTGQRARPIETETLFHTLFADFFAEGDGSTYVQTGGIPAMWLRDSSAQTIPYLRFQNTYPILRAEFAGVIARNARNILTDPYANALMSNYHVWERKWEVDSLAWPVLLTYFYWQRTGDRTIFTPALHRALQTIVSTYACERHHETCGRYVYPYRVQTSDEYARDTGMIWGAFRPSDDAVTYRFNIPQNVLAVVALHDLADIASDGFGDERLASDARTIAAGVYVGIERFGRIYVAARGGFMYAYETDGNGNFNLMDDANIPNLTTLPSIGWCSSYDPVYLRTRAFALSTDNPYYFTGTYASGLGSPHTPYGFVWPLGIIGRALSSTSSSEVADSITTLAETDSKDGLIHESFYPDGYWRFTRADFGWANAFYAELLFRSIAGFRALPFAGPTPIMPFEEPAETPTLVSPIVQLENAGAILSALGRRLDETRGGMQPAR